MTLQIAVVHEAAADFTTATELADRVLCEAIGWLDGVSPPCPTLPRLGGQSSSFVESSPIWVPSC
jgi:hypothetical protein